MDIIEAIKTRRSIRSYKPDAIPEATLREVVETALRAPSSMNTQPWEITVATGKVLEDIRQGNMEKLSAGDRPNQWGPARGYEGIYRERQVEIAVMLYQSMGIDRDDNQRRAEWWQKGMRYFDAPATLFLCVDESFPQGNGQIAIGSIAQTICLVALAHDLGTCIAVQGIMFPDVVRKYTGLPESKQLVTSIIIGYPDWDFPANDVISPRTPLEEVSTWCGFGDD